MIYSLSNPAVGKKKKKMTKGSWKGWESLEMVNKNTPVKLSQLQSPTQLTQQKSEKKIINFTFPLLLGIPRVNVRGMA